MRNSPALACALALILLCASAASADHLVVSRSGNIRAESTSASEVLKHVTEGTQLELLDDGDQENGYYHVLLEHDMRGWIYRTLVKRYPGETDAAVVTGRFGEALADPTLIMTPERIRWADRHLAIGKPQAVYERAREGYVVAFDARLKIPVWVQYELSPEDLDGDEERRDRFLQDTTMPECVRVSHDDYTNSGFDRGHMAPAEDMDRSEDVMRESFYTSNIAPQVGEQFNQHIWAYLEEAIRGWVLQRGSLYVITGPIFESDGGEISYEVVGEAEVAVPTHFFKVVVDVDSENGPEALAFILPNRELPGRSYEDFLVSIDDIEKATGLDLLSGLPTTTQKAIEKSAAEVVW